MYKWKQFKQLSHEQVHVDFQHVTLTFCKQKVFSILQNKVSPLLGYLIGYVYRTFDIFCEQHQSGTSLEKMRRARRGQKPSSHAFGMIGFVKPVLLDPWKGHRMVLSVYLGMRYVTGGGI